MKALPSGWASVHANMSTTGKYATGKYTGKACRQQRKGQLDGLQHVDELVELVQLSAAAVAVHQRHQQRRRDRHLHIRMRL